MTNTPRDEQIARAVVEACAKVCQDYSEHRKMLSDSCEARGDHENAMVMSHKSATAANLEATIRSLPLSDLVAAQPKDGNPKMPRFIKNPPIYDVDSTETMFPAAPVAQPATWISSLIKDWKAADRLIDSTWAAMQLEKAVADTVAQPDAEEVETDCLIHGKIGGINGDCPRC